MRKNSHASLAFNFVTDEPTAIKQYNWREKRGFRMTILSRFPSLFFGAM
jgi:hypothetical protein